MSINAAQSLDGQIAIGTPKFVTSVNGIKPDKNGNIEIKIDPGDIVSSWYDLQDKPFGEEQAFEPFVVNQDEYINPQGYDFGALIGVECPLFYKISDSVIVPTKKLTFHVEYYLAYQEEYGTALTPSELSCEKLVDGIPEWATLYVVNGWDVEMDDAMGMTTTTVINAPICFVHSENEYAPTGVYIAILEKMERRNIRISAESAYPIDEKYLPESYINSLIDAKLSAIPIAEEASF